MNTKKYTRFIVVGDNMRPMTFKKTQFFYCGTHVQIRPLPINLYSYEDAKEKIKRTIEYRERMGFPAGEYFLMPVEIN